MSQTTISKSAKDRRGHRMVKMNGVNVPVEYFGPFKMVVEITEAGYKKKNGKPAMISKTRHTPD